MRNRGTLRTETRLFFYVYANDEVGMRMMEEDSIVNFSFEASFPSKNSSKAFENRGSKPVNHTVASSQRFSFNDLVKVKLLNLSKEDERGTGSFKREF